MTDPTLRVPAREREENHFSVAEKLRQRVGTAVRHIRNSRDRWLHPMRHRLVRRRLLEEPRPKRILVTCLGNICRSPYLEAVLRRETPDTIVTSAGFLGPGRPVPAVSAALAKRRGLDLSEHRSRTVTAAMMREADLIIAMDARQARRLRRALGVPRDRIVIAGDLDPSTCETRGDVDPFKQPEPIFRMCFDRLDRCAATVAAALRHPSSG
jgi:protein-tyrosine phosphatase